MVVASVPLPRKARRYLTHTRVGFEHNIYKASRGFMTVFIALVVRIHYA